MTGKQEIVTTAAAAGAGGTMGAAVVAISGMSAAGMVGGGAGIGAAAGPVGVVVGAVAGIAALSIARTVDTAQRDPEVHRFIKRTRQKVGQWISGDANNIDETE